MILVLAFVDSSIIDGCQIHWSNYLSVFCQLLDTFTQFTHAMPNELLLKGLQCA